jgi:diaminohydroxyphosphoribosylaminopyrimidine deaminase/5-amino-6-(5-phosphoribosylamino)uracil reductase
VLGVVIEGGGATHGLFLEAGLADKIYWFVAPRILGDPDARPAVTGGPRPLGRIIEGRIDSVEPLGEDVLLTVYPSRPGGAGRPGRADAPARPPGASR